jgi:hypothetical protein
LKSYITFSGTITGGVFSEGGTLPFAYLWTAERIVVIIWILLLVYSIFVLSKRHPKQILIWILGGLFIYSCLVIPSVLLHKFVVYARLARQLVPFFTMAVAYGLRDVELEQQFGRSITVVVLCIILIQAGFNFLPPFLISYPVDFIKEVQSKYPDFKPPKSITFFIIRTS